jgi:hypothetical protein
MKETIVSFLCVLLFAALCNAATMPVFISHQVNSNGFDGGSFNTSDTSVLKFIVQNSKGDRVCSRPLRYGQSTWLQLPTSIALSDLVTVIAADPLSGAAIVKIKQKIVDPAQMLLSVRLLYNMTIFDDNVHGLRLVLDSLPRTQRLTVPGPVVNVYGGVLKPNNVRQEFTAATNITDKYPLGFAYSGSYDFAWSLPMKASKLPRVVSLVPVKFTCERKGNDTCGINYYAIDGAPVDRVTLPPLRALDYISIFFFGQASEQVPAQHYVIHGAPKHFDSSTCSN